MSFRSLSLTTPSSNLADAAPATPANFVFPTNVKYDYAPSGGGTIIDPITPPAPTGATLTVGTGQTYPNIQAAIEAAANGDRLLLTAETFTVPGPIAYALSAPASFNTSTDAVTYVGTDIPTLTKVQFSTPTAATATVTIANAATDFITISVVLSVFSSGAKFRFTAGTPPTGLSLGTDYWIVNASSSTFQVSLTYGGPAINFTGAQTGATITLQPFLPSPLVAGTNYWTVRQSATSSKLATSVANALANVAIDLTNQGTGSLNMTIQNVVVDKQITIQGASRAGTIIQSAGAASDAVSFLTLQSSNLVVRDCTIKHRKTSNTSVETAISVIGFSNTTPLATATGGSTTTMVVTGTPWLTNQWVGAKVTFTTGANAGLSRIVSSNTNNTLTFPALPNAVVSGNTYAVIPMNVYFENVAVENVEFAIVLRCDNWQINNCHLAYVGPNNSTRRLIAVYRSDGQGLFTNSTYDSGQNGVITGNTRVFNVLSTVGLPIETLGGYLRLGYITSSNAFPMQQFFNCESFLAGATPLTFCVDNCNMKANGSSGETSAFVVFYTPSSQPTLTRCAQINLQSNTLSNAHGKGAIALDGPGPLASPGTTTFYAGGNSFTSTAFTAGWASGVTGSSDPAALAQLGYATAIWSNPNQVITVPAGLSGLFTVDGVPLLDGYRVFVVDSSNAITSGIYSANVGAWYRAQDMVAGDDAAGDRFTVTQGTVYAGTNWLCTNTTGNGIVGTNLLTFAQV